MRIKIGAILTFKGKDDWNGTFITTIVITDIYLSNAMEEEYETLLEFKRTKVAEKQKTLKDQDTISLKHFNEEIKKYKPIISYQ
jgi:hypothetical protein